MHGSRLLSGALLLALIGGIASWRAAAADTIAASDLAGWWLAIDRTQPDLWSAVPMVPVEELLVIASSGEADTRLMVFNPLAPAICLGRHACSDAPRLQHTRFTIAGDLLAFQPPVHDNEVGVLVNIPALQKVSVTSAPVWLARLSGGGTVLFLEAPDGSGPRRMFAHVDPIELGRIRAGFLETEAGAIGSWRCFLAHATAGNPAFLPLHGGGAPRHPGSPPICRRRATARP